MTSSQTPPVQASEADTRAWYAAYYEKRGSDRNDLLSNPEVLFQSLAFDVANTRALQRLRIERENARVLDVGCGGGTSLLTFLKLGFAANNLAGIDINSARVAEGRMELPNVDFRCESAEAMTFHSNSFDIAFESTMFVQITDEEIASRIATEMLRVTRTGGYVILVDWRYSKPRNNDYRGVSKSRIAKLFEVGRRSEVITRQNGALVPPIGRWLSRNCPSLYFMIQTLIPVAVGQQTTVLRKL